MTDYTAQCHSMRGAVIYAERDGKLWRYEGDGNGGWREPVQVPMAPEAQA